MTHATVQTQSREQIRQQVQTTIRDAVRAARDGARQGQVEAAPALAGIPASPATIDALRAELTAEKAAVTTLTGQLVPGLSDSRVDAINQQLEDARDRVQTVQGQLDRALGVPQSSVAMIAPPFPIEQIPELVLPIVGVVMGTLAFMVVGWPIARAWARRMDRRNATPAAAPDMSPRFDRIEQGLEAMSIEIERISEGQRFTTKLMSEMRALPAPNPLNDWQGIKQRAGEPVERHGEGKV
jgi:hypothetical protein